MFCPACGKALEEGKTFCKYCGARLPIGTAPTPSPPPPPAGWTPPPPPGYTQVPPTPGFGAPPPSRSGSRTGLIVVIAIAALLLLGGGVAAAFFLFASTESEGEHTQTSGVVVVTTLSPGEASATTTSAPAGTGTTATVPGFDPDGTATTQGIGDTAVDATGYLQALDGLELVLVRCDERIPALATQINNSAPRVPGSVSQELDNLFADVEEARTALGEFEPPSAYEEADRYIFEAADAMQNRIDQTSKGIDAMWNAGTVTAGTPYFDEGRRARDQYRTFFDQYMAAKP